MPALALAFILIPAVELYLLISVGTHFGPMPTFALIVATGILGAALVKQQGLGLVKKINEEASQGRLPAQQLLEGLVLLFAGALLLTPGLLTDTVGFLALVPPLRAWGAKRLSERVVVGAGQTFNFPGAGFGGFGNMGGGGFGASPFDVPGGPGAGSRRPPEGDIIDVDARTVEDSEPARPADAPRLPPEV